MRGEAARHAHSGVHHMLAHDSGTLHATVLLPFMSLQGQREHITAVLSSMGEAFAAKMASGFEDVD